MQFYGIVGVWLVVASARSRPFVQSWSTLPTVPPRIPNSYTRPNSFLPQKWPQPKEHGPISALLLAKSSTDSTVSVDAVPIVKTAAVAAANIYSKPFLYDCAFGYRDYVEEVGFLLRQHQLLSGSSALLLDNDTNQTEPFRILELAAGPARHSITALLMQQQSDESTTPTSNNIRVDCVDASPAMAAYAAQFVARAAVQVPSFRPDHVQYHVADMRNFTLSLPPQVQQPPIVVDTAWMLLGSLQHLTSNDDVIACLQCIHDVLRTNGTLFLELPHPREIYFGMGECTRNSWKVPLPTENDDDDAFFATWEATSLILDGDVEDESDYSSEELMDEDQAEELLQDDDEDDENESGEAGQGELSIVWGDKGDSFDPVTQIRQFTIQFDWKSNPDQSGDEPVDTVSDSRTPLLESSGSLREIVPLRVFTVQEIDALARCAGFRVVARYGALEEGVTLDDEEASYRLVCALLKL